VSARTTLARLVRTPTGATGLVLVCVIVGCALLSLVWTPHDPTLVAARERWAPPSPQHPFGTDGLGRDRFSQVLVGARSTLVVAVLAATLAAVAGTAIGVLAAVTPRWVGEPVAQLVDVLVALPALILALVLAAVLGGSTMVAVLAIGAAEAVILARVVRAELAAVLTRDFVLAAYAAGSSTPRLVRRHLLPNVAPVLVVQLSLALALAVLAESALAYLGLGTAPPTPSWGRLLQELQASVTVHPGALVAPGAAVVATTLAFNLLGDGLRDVIDPRLRPPEQELVP
jgi:peptide/nickel transport system permease protein